MIEPCSILLPKRTEITYVSLIFTREQQIVSMYPNFECDFCKRYAIGVPSTTEKGKILSIRDNTRNTFNWPVGE